VSVLLGVGDGTFSGPTDFATGPASVAVAEWLRQQVDARRSTSEIAADVGRTPKPARDALRPNGLSMPRELRRPDLDLYLETMRADWRRGMSGRAIGRKHG
jgi:hypothetical protein